MTTGEATSAEEFAARFNEFMEWCRGQADDKENPFVELLRPHLGRDPRELPVLGVGFLPHDHPNLQLALDAYMAGPGRETKVIGILGARMHHDLGLSTVLAVPMFRPGPVDLVERPVGVDEVLACVRAGLYLVSDGGSRYAVMVCNQEGPRGPEVRVEVLATERQQAAATLDELRRLMGEHNVYRGKVVSLGNGDMRRGMPGLGVTFHTLPQLSRGDIVLADGVLQRVERHTIGIALHREVLLAGRRHLKRGLLLHGPPGTGKTLTVMYLLAQMPERTTLLLSGKGMGAVGASCALARQLQPATVVLEDVDLVAEDRGHFPGSNPLLFELLDEMDGLAEDADVIFLLTTNRADLLEPALAARPGRVDQAVDVALPDATCRQRLLELYARGLAMDVEDWAPVVEATDGVSASFIKELLREAALVSAEAGDSVVTAAHVQSALQELTVAGGALTAALLGAGGDRAPTSGPPRRGPRPGPVIGLPASIRSVNRPLGPGYV
ncbi:MAG: AAA family ATPase [Acidimicrobiales bacterium]